MARPRSHGRRETGTTADRAAFAKYLGAHSYGRFPGRRCRAQKSPANCRLRLLLLALAVFAIGLFGVWLELGSPVP